MIVRAAVNIVGHESHDRVKAMLLGTIDRSMHAGGRHRGRLRRKLWNGNNIKEWTDQSLSSLLSIADDEADGKRPASPQTSVGDPTTPKRHWNFVVRTRSSN